MTRLADTIDGVIGVDTHRDTLAAAATDRVRGTLVGILDPALRPHYGGIR